MQSQNDETSQESAEDAGALEQAGATFRSHTSGNPQGGGFSR